MYMDTFPPLSSRGFLSLHLHSFAASTSVVPEVWRRWRRTLTEKPDTQRALNDRRVEVRLAVLLFTRRLASSLHSLADLRNASRTSNMAHSPQGDGHSVMARLSRRACASSASLWTNPAASATLPVYEDVTLTWDPTCVSITSATVDLYLSIEQAASNEWQAVHEWTSVPYSPGKLDTQIKPTWWNASTGAGSVKAQVRHASVGGSSPSSCTVR